jgi:hypothetical protein
MQPSQASTSPGPALQQQACTGGIRHFLLHMQLVEGKWSTTLCRVTVACASTTNHALMYASTAQVFVRNGGRPLQFDGVHTALDEFSLPFPVQNSVLAVEQTF